MITGLNLKKDLIIVAMVLATMISTSLYSSFTFSQDQTQTHTVIISGFQFTPESLQVNAGDTIIWINQDIVPHTATAVDNSWDTGTIVSQGQTEIVVSAAQSLSYYCFYHPGMKGTLVMNSK
jgi:plastocyanin